MLGQPSGGESSPRDDAIRLLARREYSRLELAERLAAKGHASESIAECLDELADQGLQSDDRFAESFLRSRILRGQGPLKIGVELERRGLGREVIRHAFAESEQAGEGDWFTLACESLAKRFTGPGDSPRERARRERFLAQRGFAFDQVRHALEHAWDNA
ncbi:regulatory protein RecX [Halomonas lysinitropha]|uniref:Regulatory protein RecX n=1 Tax=Halomonas lysinitropha TaxID=2607506 RepID=A0A5K1I6R4_9GAMM|nr:regulatory protein RecX [Halomonas lysinitropha]VVZ95897.1 Regulatory protein RecX [Halomonas lysinitropha]